MEKKTPLYDVHVEAGGKIVPFGGFSMPVQYKAGVIAEHMAVREQAGLFDVSHMGEILLQGPDALANLNKIFTNSFDTMVDGQARYTVLCNDNGGCIDDLIVYKKADNDYFLVVNASNTDKDFQWMKDHEFGDATFTNVSDEWGQLALQGPKAMDILRKMTAEEDIPAINLERCELSGSPTKVKKTYTPVTEKNGVKLQDIEAEDAAKQVVKLIYDAKIL